MQVSPHFRRDALEGLPEDELGKSLSLLELALNRAMREQKRHPSNPDVFAVGEIVIDALRAQGHDLWSWTFDTNSHEEWGGDKNEAQTMGRLIVRVQKPWRVKIDWLLEDNSRLFGHRNQ